MATYLTDIERLNYYEGEYLGAVDFQAEQEYHRDMRRRHNIGQHTWGIVTGLDLAQAPNGGTQGSSVEVDVYLQPGMAVDGFGREIVALNQTQLTQEMFAAFYDPNPNAKPKWMYVWIAYQEALLQPPSDACTNMNVSNAFARVGESWVLNVTAGSTAPLNGALVVAGSSVVLPVPPASSSSSSASSGNAPPADPPPITLPYDNDVPFQEFSTDDSSLAWWIPLGRVMWDPHNEVFLQINSDPVQAAAAAGVNREYAGNVSATLHAPAASYIILDRNTPYPLPANASGVQVEVAGSLQVDGLLNPETSVLIGGAYDPSSATPLSPLTIVAAGTNEELIQFRNPSGAETWHICENLNGNTPGINFGQFNSAGAASEGALFLQSGNGNVGIGTTAPQQNLSVNAAINLDQAGSNAGTLNPGLTFGNNSGEGIASNRAAGGTNANGLDFYTAKAIRVSITQGGNLGIGTTAPAAQLSISGGQWDLTNTPGDIRIGNSSIGLKFGIATGGANAGDARIRAMGGSSRLMLGSGAADTLTIVNSQLGINTQTPQQDLSVNAGLNIDQGQKNNGTVNPGPALTFGQNNGASSGEGIASCRSAGGTNVFGLDFYTNYNVRMSIKQDGQVSTTGGLVVAGNISAKNFDTTGDVNANGNINAGTSVTATGSVTAPHLVATTDLTVTGDVVVNGSIIAFNTKIACVADRFINRDGVPLERGDVVVLHTTPSSQFYGSDGKIPLVEVQLTDAAFDARVCGIVDEPALADSKIRDLDRTKLGNVQVGLMVTLGAYSTCKVDADIAPISPGDLLTTSPTPGYAQKADPFGTAQPGAIIGKALGSLMNGRGLIPVLVSHQ
jgi:hypothetical protein